MSENPKLVVLSEKLRGKIFELNSDKLSVGRNPQRDICIKDGSISSYHCDFEKQPDGSWVLRDNDSTNGSRVNNVQITSQALKNSDILQLGNVEVLFDYSAGSGSVGSRTVTGIDLDSPDSGLQTQELNNLDPFANSDRKRQLMGQKLSVIIMVLLGVALLGVLVWVLTKV